MDFMKKCNELGIIHSQIRSGKNSPVRAMDLVASTEYPEELIPNPTPLIKYEDGKNVIEEDYAKYYPGLNEYEKSVFLTKAQDELIKNYFAPESNPKNKGFDDVVVEAAAEDIGVGALRCGGGGHQHGLHEHLRHLRL